MIKRYRGFSNEGTAILGYRVVQRTDYGEFYATELEVENTGREIVPSESRRQKGLRKITYRKFNKSANRR